MLIIAEETGVWCSLFLRQSRNNYPVEKVEWSNVLLQSDALKLGVEAGLDSR